MAAAIAAAAAMAAAVAAPFPVERGIVALEGAKTQTEPTAVPVTKKMRLSAELDKFSDASTADAVIVEMLLMSYMSVLVVMPMAVMKETAALTAPVSTPSCTAMSNSPHAPTANAVIVELLMMCYMCVQVVMPMFMMEETAALTVPVSTPSCTAMSKSPHAPTANAVIVELLMMCYMCVQVVMPMAVMEVTAALAALV